ncbi:hypothetical protein [Mucilaginibacter sp. FT3.2]|uniref:hypothetical protein n=1 Tax=Mucilaginibacter sp. FT3.2 TaxID=2723090 RepID=UPI00160B09FC|nr:hypothetical protein [Mucilaginibacter sp. FT3.2]MBB6234232.1 hypothetical protein [Mucilaginibacter sp. FT3.2]
MKKITLTLLTFICTVAFSYAKAPDKLSLNNLTSTKVAESSGKSLSVASSLKVDAPASSGLTFVKMKVENWGYILDQDDHVIGYFSWEESATGSMFRLLTCQAF